MNTLTAIEADRVNLIMRNALDRMRVMSYVPTSWDDNILADLECQPVITALEKSWTAEEQLRALAEGDGMGGGGGGGRDITLAKIAAKATRGTCRNLQADRDSLQVIMSRPEAQSTEEMSRFLKYLSELTAQVHTRMTTTVEDEAANRALLHDLTEKERVMEGARDVLQVNLTEVTEEKESASFQLDQTLRKLQLELQEITGHNNLELESVQREMTEAIAKATSDHDLRMRQLQGNVDSTERGLGELMERNREEEQRMRKEKNRTEAALNAKIAQYDEDMSARLKMLTDLRASHAAESAEYATLKEHFDRIDADLAMGREEEMILAAVARRADLGRKIVDTHVTNIQRIVRGKLHRNLVNKLKPKKVGGKKKK